MRWGVLPGSKEPNSAIVNIYEQGDCIPPHIGKHLTNQYGGRKDITIHSVVNSAFRESSCSYLCHFYRL